MKEDKYSEYSEVSSRHPRRGNGLRNFFDRVGYGVGGFFYRLFRPVRRFFRWIFRSSERMNDGIAQRVDQIGEKAYERRSLLEAVDVHSEDFLPGLERLRLILMFFMCIDLLGFPTAYGELVETVCGFVTPAFFILSGYLALWEREDRSQRIARSIGRTAIVFAVLAVAYFSINLIYYRLLGVNIFSAFASKRFWFNFVVLNVWPFDIGGAIWYVQALLYTYIILYFMDKWKLLKLDWLFAALFLAFAVVTGELAGVIRWELLGYTFLPGNFLTRALPYTLLGGFIHRKMGKLHMVRRIWYYCGIVVGIILMFAETLVLGLFGMPGYYGHLVGMGVVAFSVCLLAFQEEDYPGFEGSLKMSRWHTNCIYYFCQPVSVGVAVLLSVSGGGLLADSVGFIGFITFIICFCLARIFAGISRAGSLRKLKKANEETT